MKKWMIVLFAASFSSGFLPGLMGATAQAVPSVQPGDYVKFSDSYGSTGGGEFTASIYRKAGDVFTPTGADFTTFCLETNEYLDFTTYFYLDSISNQAVNGGVSGPQPDPISEQTAYLYANFATGSLSGYAYGSGSLRILSANSLQRAIWYLEGEVAYSTLDGQARNWVTEANSYGGPSYLPYVWVMNPVSFTSTGAEINRQSQLFYQKIPEPGTFLLLGMGLMGLAGAAGMRRRRET